MLALSKRRAFEIKRKKRQKRGSAVRAKLAIVSAMVALLHRSAA